MHCAGLPPQTFGSAHCVFWLLQAPVAVLHVGVPTSLALQQTGGPQSASFVQPPVGMALLAFASFFTPGKSGLPSAIAPPPEWSRRPAACHDSLLLRVVCSHV